MARSVSRFPRWKVLAVRPLALFEGPRSQTCGSMASLVLMPMMKVGPVGVGMLNRLVCVLVGMPGVGWHGNGMGVVVVPVVVAVPMPMGGPFMRVPMVVTLAVPNADR